MPRNTLAYVGHIKTVPQYFHDLYIKRWSDAYYEDHIRDIQIIERCSVQSTLEYSFEFKCLLKAGWLINGFDEYWTE